MASSRLRKVSADEGEELQVDMSPMIDMAFLLLIFFLVNAVMLVVKLDTKVQVSIAENSKKQETANGRIVMNVYEDGIYATANGRDEEPFNPGDDQAIVDYLQGLADQFEGKYEPILHLRADKRAQFFRARHIIRLAARVGIKDIRFATYLTDK